MKLLTRQELTEKWNLCNKKSTLGNVFISVSIQDTWFVFTLNATAF